MDHRAGNYYQGPPPPHPNYYQGPQPSSYPQGGYYSQPAYHQPQQPQYVVHQAPPPKSTGMGPAAGCCLGTGLCCCAEMLCLATSSFFKPSTDGTLIQDAMSYSSSLPPPYALGLLHNRLQKNQEQEQASNEHYNQHQQQQVDIETSAGSHGTPFSSHPPEIENMDSQNDYSSHTNHQGMSTNNGPDVDGMMDTYPASSHVVPPLSALNYNNARGLSSPPGYSSPAPRSIPAHFAGHQPTNQYYDSKGQYMSPPQQLQIYGENASFYNPRLAPPGSYYNHHSSLPPKEQSHMYTPRPNYQNQGAGNGAKHGGGGLEALLASLCCCFLVSQVAKGR